MEKFIAEIFAVDLDTIGIFIPIGNRPTTAIPAKNIALKTFAENERDGEWKNSQLSHRIHFTSFYVREKLPPTNWNQCKKLIPSTVCRARNIRRADSISVNGNNTRERKTNILFAFCTSARFDSDLHTILHCRNDGNGENMINALCPHHAHTVIWPQSTMAGWGIGETIHTFVYGRLNWNSNRLSDKTLFPTHTHMGTVNAKNEHQII